MEKLKGNPEEHRYRRFNGCLLERSSAAVAVAIANTRAHTHWQIQYTQLSRLQSHIIQIKWIEKKKNFYRMIISFALPFWMLFLCALFFIIFLLFHSYFCAPATSFHLCLSLHPPSQCLIFLVLYHELCFCYKCKSVCASVCSYIHHTSLFILHGLLIVIINCKSLFCDSFTPVDSTFFRIMNETLAVVLQRHVFNST